MNYNFQDEKMRSYEFSLNSLCLPYFAPQNSSEGLLENPFPYFQPYGPMAIFEKASLNNGYCLAILEGTDCGVSHNHLLNEIPDLIWLKIFSYLEIKEVAEYAYIHRFFYAIIISLLHFNYVKVFKTFVPYNFVSPNQILSLHEDIKVANPKKGLTNLLTIIRYGYFEKARQIVRSLADYINPLINILTNNDYDKNSKTESKEIAKDMINSVIGQGSSIHKSILPILLACQENKKNIVEFLFNTGVKFSITARNHSKYNCGQLAILNKNMSLLKFIIKNTVNPILYENSISSSLACITISMGDPELLKFLLDCYKDLDIDLDQLGIHYAIGLSIENNFYTLVYSFSLYKVSMNSLDYNDLTPLMLSCKLNKEACFTTVLKDKSLNINIINSKGKTALYYASKYSSPNILEDLLFLKPNADTYSKISKKSPLFVAVDRNNEKIIRLMVKYCPVRPFKMKTSYGVNVLQHSQKVLNFEPLINFIKNTFNKIDEADYIQKMKILLPNVPIILIKLRRKLLMNLKKCFPYNLANLDSKIQRRNSYSEFLSKRFPKKKIQIEETEPKGPPYKIELPEVRIYSWKEKPNSHLVNVFQFEKLDFCEQIKILKHNALYMLTELRRILKKKKDEQPNILGERVPISQKIIDNSQFNYLKIKNVRELEFQVSSVSRYVKALKRALEEIKQSKARDSNEEIKKFMRILDIEIRKFEKTEQLGSSSPSLLFFIIPYVKGKIEKLLQDKKEVMQRAMNAYMASRKPVITEVKESKIVSEGSNIIDSTNSKALDYYKYSMNSYESSPKKTNKANSYLKKEQSLKNLKSKAILKADDFSSYAKRSYSDNPRKEPKILKRKELINENENLDEHSPFPPIDEEKVEVNNPNLNQDESSKNPKDLTNNQNDQRPNLIPGNELVAHESNQLKEKLKKIHRNNKRVLKNVKINDFATYNVADSGTNNKSNSNNLKIIIKKTEKQLDNNAKSSIVSSKIEANMMDRKNHSTYRSSFGAKDSSFEKPISSSKLTLSRNFLRMNTTNLNSRRKSNKCLPPMKLPQWISSEPDFKSDHVESNIKEKEFDPVLKKAYQDIYKNAKKRIMTSNPKIPLTSASTTEPYLKPCNLFKVANSKDLTSIYLSKVYRMLKNGKIIIHERAKSQNSIYMLKVASTLYMESLNEKMKNLNNVEHKNQI